MFFNMLRVSLNLNILMAQYCKCNANNKTMTTSVPQSENSSLPLSTMILCAHPEDPNKIGQKLPPTTMNIANIRAFRDQLTLAQVPHQVLEDSVIGQSVSGVSGTGPYVCGVEIEGKEDIARFKAQGGVIITPDALQGITFGRAQARAREPITYPLEGAKIADVLRVLEEGNIRFTQDAHNIVISDPTSMHAVLLCGGRFNGSAAFLQGRGLPG